MAGDPMKDLVEQLMQAVRDDVAGGLSSMLTLGEVRFDGPFAPEPARLPSNPDGVEALVDVGGRWAVVQWRVEGVDDKEGVNDMEPTEKRLTVAGVTIVDTGSEPWRFHRHIDWNEVNSQLGGSRGRSTVRSFRGTPGTPAPDTPGG